MNGHENRHRTAARRASEDEVREVIRLNVFRFRKYAFQIGVNSEET